MSKLLFNFFLLGLSLGFGPCLVTCGPLLISYIAGTQKNVIKSIRAYLLFSLSRVSVYAVLGIAVFLFGQLISKYSFSALTQYLFLCGGVFIMFIGLIMVMGKNLDNKFCRWIEQTFLKKDAKTIFIFGLIIGIMPCLPFVSLLTYIGLVSGTLIDALFYSLSFGLGTVISPLLIIAALTGLIPRIIIKTNRLYRFLNAACGIIIMFLGMQLAVKTFR